MKFFLPGLPKSDRCRKETVRLFWTVVGPKLSPKMLLRSRRSDTHGQPSTGVRNLSARSNTLISPDPGFTLWHYSH